MQIASNNFQKENVFAIESEAEFVKAFRPKDQKKLVLPEKIKFPIRVRSYLSWQEPNGIYTFLVFKAPHWDHIRGIVFKKTTASGEPVGGLCSWCHSFGTSEEIDFLTVQLNSKESSSYILCQRIKCIEKIEEMAGLSGKNPEKYIADLYYKIEKMFERVSGYKIED